MTLPEPETVMVRWGSRMLTAAPLVNLVVVVVVVDLLVEGDLLLGSARLAGLGRLPLSVGALFETAAANDRGLCVLVGGVRVRVGC